MALLSTEYNLPAKEINNGMCGEFARNVIAEHPQARQKVWQELVPWNTYDTAAGHIFGDHVWIVYDVTGRHYDAESPNGVKNFWELPHFQRNISQSEYDSAIDIIQEAHTQKRW